MLLDGKKGMIFGVANQRSIAWAITRAAKEAGVAGEVWSVHGGGFYRAQKYDNAPAQLPRTLHWFKWEAYTTWISGMALLVLVYYMGAELFLIDHAVLSVSTRTASAPVVAASIRRSESRSG